MFIKDKTSKMHANKTFEMREGVQGNGKPLFEIYTMVSGVCKNIEQFKHQGEAEGWWKHACN